jgi:hypothetical protein
MGENPGKGARSHIEMCNLDPRGEFGCGDTSDRGFDKSRRSLETETVNSSTMKGA